jgi:hypothetical protein
MARIRHRLVKLPGSNIATEVVILRPIAGKEDHLLRDLYFP